MILRVAPALLWVLALGGCALPAGGPPPVAPVAPTPEANPFADIDAHALAAPVEVTTSVAALSAYLTGPAANDSEKARAIFRWITANVRFAEGVAFIESLDANTADDVVRSRRAVCGGFSNLFHALAEASGLEVATIPGHAKGVDYEVGAPLRGKANHAWNAVRVDGAWRLVDCTWGAGKFDAEDVYHEGFDPYYFFPPPAQLRYTHLPTDPDWQLVKPAITRDEFERLPLLKSTFFRLGLDLLAPQEACPPVVNGHIVVRLIVPPTIALAGRVLDPSGRTVGEADVREVGAEWHIDASAASAEPRTLRIFAGPNTEAPDGYLSLDWVADFGLQAAEPVAPAPPRMDRIPPTHDGQASTI